MSAQGFRKELEHLINRESQENGSNTPDFILAEYLSKCLTAFDETVNRREQWYGRGPVVSPAPSGPNEFGDNQMEPPKRG